MDPQHIGSRRLESYRSYRSLKKRDFANSVNSDLVDRGWEVRVAVIVEKQLGVHKHFLLGSVPSYCAADQRRHA